MEEVLDTREQVIKAAIDLFSTKGFNGTSIRAIANAMGMSISNIYHYFVNKEGLMLAILEQSSKRLLETLHQVSEKEMDPLDRFKLLIETHVRLSEMFSKESKIFFLDEDHLSPEGNEKNRQNQREILNIYLKELQTLKELGYLSSRNLVVLAFNILGVINWQLKWYRPGGPLSMDIVANEIVSFVMHGLLGEKAQAQSFCSPTPPLMADHAK
jgi:AcrR family transcriptional regulator